jgi:hypothetical protein
MARPNPIRAIMESPLPSITYQRRLQFRPSHADINYAYNKLNFYLFDNQLRRPEIVKGTRRKTWAFCMWEHEEQDSGSHCVIKIMDKWFCPQWFIQTLAHEMVHQYQWDIDRFDGYGVNENSGSHGPSFFAHRERFSHYGLHLKTAYGMKRWFKWQDFTRC